MRGGHGPIRQSVQDLNLGAFDHASHALAPQLTKTYMHLSSEMFPPLCGNACLKTLLLLYLVHNNIITQISFEGKCMHLYVIDAAYNMANTGWLLQLVVAWSTQFAIRLIVMHTTVYHNSLMDLPLII